MSKPGNSQAVPGNCLTVYSDLDIAPMRKPFKATPPQELPVYVKSIIKTDPSLTQLLRCGCISIAPVNTASELPKATILPGGTEHFSRLLKEPRNDLKAIDIADNTKLEIEKIIPVHDTAAVNSKTVPQTPHQDCSGYSRHYRAKVLSNEEDLSLNSNEDSEYDGNINPSDLLEVYMEEEDSKIASYGAKYTESECHICGKCFASPIDMYFHVLSHSNSIDSNQEESRYRGYNDRLDGLPDIEITATRKVHFDGGVHRYQKFERYQLHP